MPRDVALLSRSSAVASSRCAATWWRERSRSRWSEVRVEVAVPALCRTDGFDDVLRSRLDGLHPRLEGVAGRPVSTDLQVLEMSGLLGGTRAELREGEGGLGLR